PMATEAGTIHVGRPARSFNRFELKYLVDRQTAVAFRDDVVGRLDPDPHHVDGGYTVWSRYYDSTDLHCYWQKIDGIRFRRKLRVRHYGSTELLRSTTPVWVEIKQRIDRSTQKKRIRLPYDEALRLCDGRVEVDHEPVDARVVGEVLSLAHERDLRPVCLVGYEREALLGRDADLGLRITFDRRLRGRDRDLDLGIDALNRHLIRPDLMVIEVKVDERVPYWLTNRLAAHSLRLVRLSKYCQGVEAFGQAPRSVFHIPESDDPVPDRASDRQEGKT
ncbi:MAG TPA: polyphosphate polymerase domain-containing protein, partial [Acidimicrobiales bacterium]|nr:polyphosphate polymerase domain-containing protein [Acidimicrobiales bacterium]